MSAQLPSMVTVVQPSGSTFTSAAAGVDHRLDGQHHSCLQTRPFTPSTEVGHLRVFVHGTADSVADELLDHAESLGLAHLLDGGGYVAQTTSSLGLKNCLLQGRLGHVEQLAVAGVGVPTA